MRRHIYTICLFYWDIFATERDLSVCLLYHVKNKDYKSRVDIIENLFTGVFS